MPPLPYKCDRCGLVFTSNAIAIEDSFQITLSGGISVTCPRCGSLAQGLEGTFDFLDKIRVHYATPRSREILAILESALQAAREGKPQQEVISQIERESPELASLAIRAVNTGGMAMLIAMLLYLLASCSQNTRQTLDWNLLADQAHVYLTGKEPYPGLAEQRREQPDTEVRPAEQRSEPTRQQQRHAERQAKKQRKQIDRASKPKKPKRPKAPR